MLEIQRRGDAQKGLEGHMSDVFSLLKGHCPLLRPWAHCFSSVCSGFLTCNVGCGGAAPGPLGLFED